MPLRRLQSLLAWLCVLLIAAGSFVRPGTVLCISDHGHLRLEVNCASACEDSCRDTAPTSQGERPAALAAAPSDCRDVPVELCRITVQRPDNFVANPAPTCDLPIAILDVPLALANARVPQFDSRDRVPKQREQLSALGGVILNI